MVILIAALGVGVTRVSAYSPKIAEAGWGPLSAGAGFRPKTLPKETLAPIDIAFNVRILPFRTPPVITQMTFDLDRNGAIDAIGLPRCTRGRLQELGTKSARRICRKAIVGTGVAHFESPTAQRTAIALTLFNAGVRGDVTTVFVHGVPPAPRSTPAIVTIRVKRINQGRFGLQSVATMPLIPAENGWLRDFSFTIDRRFMDDGEKRSFAMARCPDGHLDGQLKSLSLSTGEQLEGQSLIRACTTR